MSRFVPSPLSRRELFKALDACTLIHTPPQLNPRAIATRRGGASPIYRYRVAEPAGEHTPEYLNALFDADTQLPDNSSFEHPVVVGAKDDPVGRYYPLFDDCGNPAFERNPDGIIRGDKADQYLLLARNETEEPVGYIDFQISLDYCEEDDPEELIQQPDVPADAESDALKAIYLTMRVNGVHVRKEHRRRGAAEALVRTAGFAFKQELERLAFLCARLCLHWQSNIFIRPYLEMDLDSHSQEIVVRMLEVELEEALFEESENKLSPYLIIEDLISDVGY